ncbi:78 kDa glucose-regulated protein precursor [Cordyceps javanica]|uniref:non-chaperonin molecular chaperone ATPase n=1 Tax=Cordyceps javanica TaxID=43265 RepID=A0A545UQI1_9HYPO|nr:78 kDa glucose-regulated protein precursor [Cordyceps javanica]TQW03505.1 78 kDa glucose-regulated protein precursor [Cordyceps javanica]
MFRLRRQLAVGLLACVALLLTARFLMRAPNGKYGTVIAIDLGTAYSRVSVMKNGKMRILANAQGNIVTPSYVAFTKEGRLVGDSAKNQAAANPFNTVFDVKRLIGRKFDQADVKADIERFPFTVVSKDNNPMIQVETNEGKKQFTPEEILAMILTEMKEIAEGYLGSKVTHAVITVPANFNDSQRYATKKAGTIAGLTILRMIDEPIAAGMAYNLDMDVMDDERCIIVYDLGNTFDLSLLSIDGGFVEILSTTSDPHLGGEEFDQRIVNFFVDSYNSENNVDISKDFQAIGRLKREVERAKYILSSQTSTHIEIGSFFEGKDFSEILTRAKLEELNMNLFKQTITCMDQVLKEADIKKSRVDDIVLVGGSSHIPRVQSLIEEYFDGKKVKDLDRDGAIVIGAGEQAGIMSDGHWSVYLVLTESSPLTLGIETAGGIMSTLIPRHSPMPTRKSRIFSTTADNQRAVLVKVFEGERSMTRGNTLLGKLELAGIPLASRGIPEIEVSFELIRADTLQVSAVEKTTGKQESITILRKGRLSEEEINRLVNEAANHADEDKASRERVDCNNLGDFPSSLKSLDGKGASNYHDEL